jgi:uncharacterized protein (UPF0262 family)
MSEPTAVSPARTAQLFAITIDQNALGQRNANVEHEREVAIFDLLDGNSFALAGRDDGPYKLHLSVAEDRLVLLVGNASEDALLTHQLGLAPFRRILKDYFIVCDSYYQAIRTAPPSRIQAIDVDRRALHDEGSRLLLERLAGKINIDFDTARRLFTLICALHWKG